jgi:hypothetical protein
VVRKISDLVKESLQEPSRKSYTGYTASTSARQSKKIEQRNFALKSVFEDVMGELKRVRGAEGLNLEFLKGSAEKIATQSARMFTRANTTAYGFDAFSEYLSGKKGTKSFVKNVKGFLSEQGLPEKTAEVLAAGFVGAAKLLYEGKFETGRQQFDVGRARVSGEAGANINTNAYDAAIDIRNLADIAGGSLNVAGNINTNEFQNYAGEVEADWQDRNTRISAGLTADQQRIRQLKLEAAVNKPFGLDIGQVYAEASGSPSNIQDAGWEAGLRKILFGEEGYVSPYIKGTGPDVQQLGLTAGYDLGEFGQLSATGSITPEGEGRARLGYTTPLDKITESLFKKGGKVTKKRKKRKTKKYSKGCAVRTAKY